MARKTVAVIGAGPSGLTAAKSLLAHNLQPTIFERRASVGGLWSSSSGTVNLNPDMRTNLSRYSCAFPDLAWPEEVDLFPTVGEVGEYLEKYRRRYIPDEALRLGCRVTGIAKEEGEGGKWKVKWVEAREEGSGVVDEGEYDFLVICSGFFAEPYIPPLPTSSFPGTLMHSTYYKWPHPLLKGRKKIVVIGGSTSSIEVAADLALRISSLPEKERKDIQLIHLFPRAFWVIPRYFSLPNAQTPSALRFLPADLLLYDVNRRFRLPVPLEDMSQDEQFLLANTFISENVGGYQEEISPELHISGSLLRQSPWVCISDSYLGFARSGVITPVVGRLEKADGSTLHTLSGEEIKDVDAIIMGTGFHPVDTLRGFLPASLLAELTGCEPPNIPEDPNFLPLLLHRQCLHPAFGRQGGCVGMYKGPYFGIMELQGRWLAGLLSGSLQWPTSDEMHSDIHKLSLRRSSRAQGIRSQGERAQWTNGDYLGLIDGLRTTLSLPLTPDVTSTHPNPVTPAHFAPGHPEAIKTLTSMYALIDSIAVPPPKLGRGIFGTLHGSWTLSRTITSAAAFPSFHSGTFVGTATFTPRAPTFSLSATTPPTCITTTPPPTVSSGEILEYLYFESGTFSSTNGNLTIPAHRHYIYRYDPTSDSITVWFVKSDSTSVDYLFHEVSIVGCHPRGGWEAKSEHLCKNDWYWPRYRFSFKAGGVLERLEIGYGVKGPKKEYNSFAEYRRA